MLPCCEYWITKLGYKSCKGCSESIKAHNEFGRKQARLEELSSNFRELALLARIAELPRCRICGNPLVLEQYGTHGVCSSIGQAFHFTAKAKKTK